jgi:hypothetical protein
LRAIAQLRGGLCRKKEAYADAVADENDADNDDDYDDDAS